MWTAAYSPAWSTRRISSRRRLLAPRPGRGSGTRRSMVSVTGGAGILGPLGGEKAEYGERGRDQRVPSCHAQTEEAPRHRVAHGHAGHGTRAQRQRRQALQIDLAAARTGGRQVPPLQLAAHVEDGGDGTAGEDHGQQEGGDTRRAPAAPADQMPDGGDQGDGDGAPIDLALLEAEVAGRQAGESLERMRRPQHGQRGHEGESGPPPREESIQAFHRTTFIAGPNASVDQPLRSEEPHRQERPDQDGHKDEGPE